MMAEKNGEGQLTPKLIAIVRVVSHLLKSGGRGFPMDALFFGRFYSLTP